MNDHDHDHDLPSHIVDQVQAARRQSDFWANVLSARGARRRDVHRDQMAPALRRIMQRFDAGMERSVAAGKMCAHKDPRRAQPTHLFACEPDLRLCDRCAAPPLAAGSNVCDLCDQTCDPTLVHLQQSYLTFHAALCDTCYPEGADAPRQNTDP